MSYVVAQQTPEIRIQMALVRREGRWCGWFAAYPGQRIIERQLFEVSARRPALMDPAIALSAE